MEYVHEAQKSGCLDSKGGDCWGGSDGRLSFYAVKTLSKLWGVQLGTTHGSNALVAVS